MLHPSYTELMEKINNDDMNGDAPVVNSRYSIVIASSKRAREIIAGSDPLVISRDGEKPLSIAVKELYNSKVTILPEESEEVSKEEPEEGKADQEENNREESETQE